MKAACFAWPVLGHFRGASSWVGVIARYADDRNYLCVSLHPNNTLTVRRLVNGRIQEMANLLPGFPITPGRWYTIRVEIVKGWMYVYVDDQVMYGVSAPFGPYGPNPGGEVGKVGLVTYRAAAEYDDFVAYQP